MRVRKKINGLRVFGGGLQSFWSDQPDGPAQVAGSRLALWQGQWFLALSEGTPWKTAILGKFTGSTRDAAVRARILGTPGITGIVNYSSSLSRDTRLWSVSATLNTAYGAIPFQIMAAPQAPQPIVTPALSWAVLSALYPGQLSLNGGVVVVSGGFPTSIPATSMTPYSNGGVLCMSPGLSPSSGTPSWAFGLPVSSPGTPGLVYLDGGVFVVS